MADALPRILVTGGCGFIGSALVRHLIKSGQAEVINLDALTYAGHLENVAEVAAHPSYHFVEGDIADAALVGKTLEVHEPDAIFHLAAETHVDRSIDGAAPFIQTNITGTFVLLEAARSLAARNSDFRFIHVSTDEVYGELGAGGLFSPASPYQPNSPYSASKAAADHLARAWHRTYGVPVITTNCSNNFGPYQFPEKLIPLVIEKARTGQPIPVYGTGENVRDWLYVRDHAKALIAAWRNGTPGAVYTIGAREERTNLQVVQAICAVMDKLRPADRPYERLITFVADRPGHDHRYAIDPDSIEALGWQPEKPFDAALEATIQWYLDHPDWCDTVSGGYEGERLGTGT